MDVWTMILRGILLGLGIGLMGYLRHRRQQQRSGMPQPPQPSQEEKPQHGGETDQERPRNK